MNGTRQLYSRLVGAGDLDEQLRRAGAPAEALEVEQALATTRANLLGRRREVVVGRYRIGERIGSGGCGSVYRAHDPELDRTVALKLVSPEPIDRARDRLLREAKALAALNDPNVAVIYDAGEWQDQVYIAMEYVDGPTLRRWVNDRTRTPAEILARYRAAGMGLAAAHEAGIVHRDFKPDNALIGSDGRVRVLDFGLAVGERDSEDSVSTSAVEIDSSRITREGMVVGTPAYMAPEQLEGRPASALSDQFSFCVALFEALAGKRPFASRREASDRQRRLGPAPPDVPLRAWRAIERGLSADPEARWSSMNVLIDALRPKRRAGRWLAYGCLAVVPAVLWFAVPPAAERCEVGAQRLGAVWGGARRESLAQGFSEGDWVSIRDGLDARAHAWREGYTDVCAREPRDARFDAEMRCLDERLGELDAAVEVLQQIGSAAGRAREVVHELPDARTCANDDRTPEMNEPEGAADVRAQVSRALAYMRAGDREQARAIGEAALAEAEALGSSSLLRRARAALGEIVLLHGAPERGADLYEAVYWSASEAGDDTMAAEAARTLVYLHGWRRGDLETGRRWARHARASLDRLEDRPLLEAKLAASQGSMEFAAGHSQDATAHFERAAKILTSIDPTDPRHGYARTLTATNEGHRGNIALFGGDLEAARGHYRNSLTVLTETYGRGHPRTARMLSNLANVDAREGNLEAARSGLLEAYDIMKATGGEGTAEVATMLMNLGRVTMGLGQHDASRRYLERAERDATAVYGRESIHVARVLSNRGALEEAVGRTEDARKAHAEALQLREQLLGPEHRDVAISLRGIGNRSPSSR